MSEPVPQRSLGTSAALTNVAGYTRATLIMGLRGEGHSFSMGTERKCAKDPG